jgi:hypothetical protein
VGGTERAGDPDWKSRRLFHPRGNPVEKNCWKRGEDAMIRLVSVAPTGDKRNMKDYISGGYYVVKTIPRPNDLSDILPDTILTMSKCFSPVMRDIVQLQWDEYENVSVAIAEEAIEFRIPQDQIADLVRWVKGRHNTSYFVFTELTDPLELLSRFITDGSAHVVGIGLHTSLLESFKSQQSKDVNNGLGLVELVEEKRPLAEGGVPLGYEPLGFEGTSFHSWLCHYAPNEVQKRFGIRPNRLGLIDKFEDACQVNEYLLETGAEPAIWEPWLLIEYAAKASKETA